LISWIPPGGDTEIYARELPDSLFGRNLFITNWLRANHEFAPVSIERAKFARVCNSESQDTAENLRGIKRLGSDWKENRLSPFLLNSHYCATVPPDTATQTD
jgi:hypothetical protein